MSKILLMEQVKNDVLQTVRKQISQKNILKVFYNNQYRIVEPYVLGYTTAGNLQVRAYQIMGGSLRGITTGWKLMRLDRMEKQEYTGRNFQRPREFYNPRDRGMERIVAIQTFETPTPEQKSITPLEIPKDYRTGITQITNLKLLLQKISRLYSFVKININEELKINTNQETDEAIQKELNKRNLINQYNTDMKNLQRYINQSQKLLITFLRISPFKIFNTIITKYNFDSLSKLQSHLTKVLNELVKLQNRYTGITIGIDNKTNSLEIKFDETNQQLSDNETLMQNWGRIDGMLKELIRYLETTFGYKKEEIFRGK